MTAADRQLPRARPHGSGLLVLDVDGVLTDGRLYFGAAGEEMKMFHVRDGSGLVALQRAGVTRRHHLRPQLCRGGAPCARSSASRHVRAGRARQGRRARNAAARRLGARPRRKSPASATTRRDLPMIDRAALAIAVADAHADVIEAADWVTTHTGGDGAVREVCDLLLRARQAPASADRHGIGARRCRAALRAAGGPRPRGAGSRRAGGASWLLH